MRKFWSEHPALLYSILTLIGISMGFHHRWILIFPLILLLIQPLKRALLAFGFFMIGFLIVTSHYHFPDLPKEGMQGTGRFVIHSISTSSTTFGKQWRYRGTLKQFDGCHVQNLPCSLSFSAKSEINRPVANRDYWISGLLQRSNNGFYFLKINERTPWYKIPNSFSFAESRFQAKESVSKYIKRHIIGSNSANFLAGIATGNFEDRIMIQEFVRFGLQHIMAISGFHFSIIASILSMGFLLIFPRKTGSLLLIFAMSTYFLFLGPGPSILRAWISISIALMAHFLERDSSGLNALGISILVISLYDPYMTQMLGFQFSVATTAAILLFFPLLDDATSLLLTHRSLTEMIKMDRLNQHAYCFLTMFRKGLALTLAVNIIAFPLMLFYFQKFPWMSLAYNLFFPFMVSISMLLLIIGLIFPPVHTLNSYYTHFMLNIVSNMPMTVDYILRVKPIPFELIVVYLTIAFGGGIWLTMWKQRSTLGIERLV